MADTRQAQIQLNELKHGVINLFRSRNSNVFELVTVIQIFYKRISLKIIQL